MITDCQRLWHDGSAWQLERCRVFVWDGWNIVLERIENADIASRIVEYYWGSDLSGTEQGAGGVGGLLAVSCDGKFYIPLYDDNGNIREYVDSSGGLAAKFEYDPFGNVVSVEGDIVEPPPPMPGVEPQYVDRTGLHGREFSFGFSTKYHDREVGLVAYQLRSYSPRLGRWLNRDPIEEEDINVYVFCNNDPIGQIDMFGMKTRSALAPTKCSEKDIDSEARKILINAVALTQQGRPRLEHYGNLCCVCRKGKYEVIVTGPISGKIVVGYSRHKGRSHRQETPASFPDDPRIRCPRGSQRVGYYHTHVSGRSFSRTDLEILESRDHRYYMSQDGKRIEKAIPQRSFDPVPNVFVPDGIPADPIVVVLE